MFNWEQTFAAGSVVADNFPDDSVIMGNPAKLFLKQVYKKLSLSSRLTLFDSVCSFPSSIIQLRFQKKFILDKLGVIENQKKKDNKVLFNLAWFASYQKKRFDIIMCFLLNMSL